MKTTARNTLRTSFIAGAVVAVVVLAVGLALTFTKSRPYTAEASAVVLPAPSADTEALAGYYDTLSRGQVVATTAEIARLKRFETAAADALRIDDVARRSVEVTVQVVPDTALITVRAAAPSADVAERMSDAVLVQATEFVGTLGQPYELQPVSEAKGTATPGGAGAAKSAAILAVVALVAGAAAQQAVHQLTVAATTRRRRDMDDRTGAFPGAAIAPERDRDRDVAELFGLTATGSGIRRP